MDGWPVVETQIISDRVNIRPTNHFPNPEIKQKCTSVVENDHCGDRDPLRSVISQGQKSLAKDEPSQKLVTIEIDEIINSDENISHKDENDEIDTLKPMNSDDPLYSVNLRRKHNFENEHQRHLTIRDERCITESMPVEYKGKPEVKLHNVLRPFLGKQDIEKMVI